MKEKSSGLRHAELSRSEELSPPTFTAGCEKSGQLSVMTRCYPWLFSPVLAMHFCAERGSRADLIGR
jgi:hypothetical protein